MLSMKVLLDTYKPFPELLTKHSSKSEDHYEVRFQEGSDSYDKIEEDNTADKAYLRGLNNIIFMHIELAIDAANQNQVTKNCLTI